MKQTKTYKFEGFQLRTILNVHLREWRAKRGGGLRREKRAEGGGWWMKTLYFDMFDDPVIRKNVNLNRIWDTGRSLLGSKSININIWEPHPSIYNCQKSA